MNKKRRGVAVVLTMLLSATPLHSVAQQSGEAEVLDELDTVLVNGQKVTRKPSIIISWMRRLVGQFSYEGFVDLHGQGNPEDQLPVRGRADCIGFGPAPAVQCEINVQWPERKGPNGEEILGGVSNLTPAMILYGFEPDDLGIRYMLVDSKGIAEPSLGLLIGDTLNSKAPCVNVPGNCQRTVNIFADPELKYIRMQIDVEQDYKAAVAYTFVMNRVSAAPVGGVSKAR